MRNFFWTISLSLFLNAHFLTILPSSENISNSAESNIKINMMFIHPFEQSGMNMEKPIGLFVNKKQNTLPLTKTNKFNHTAWNSNYQIKKPGVYTFFVQPKPYFEKSEQKFISHVPKVMVSAFGLEKDWDKPLGLKYEIVPLTKPFGLYSGNQFIGKVLHNNKEAANIEVEVELYNEFGLKAPTSSHITQVVKTNKNGNFSFVMNHKGWWGFAALIQEGTNIYEGKNYPVENGALIWIKAY